MLYTHVQQPRKTYCLTHISSHGTTGAYLDNKQRAPGSPLTPTVSLYTRPQISMQTVFRKVYGKECKRYALFIAHQHWDASATYSVVLLCCQYVSGPISGFSGLSFLLEAGKVRETSWLCFNRFFNMMELEDLFASPSLIRAYHTM